MEKRAKYYLHGDNLDIQIDFDRIELEAVRDHDGSVIVHIWPQQKINPIVLPDKFNQWITIFERDEYGSFPVLMFLAKWLCSKPSEGIIHTLNFKTSRWSFYDKNSDVSSLFDKVERQYVDSIGFVLRNSRNGAEVIIDNIEICDHIAYNFEMKLTTSSGKEAVEKLLDMDDGQPMFNPIRYSLYKKNGDNIDYQATIYTGGYEGVSRDMLIPRSVSYNYNVITLRCYGADIVQSSEFDKMMQSGNFGGMITDTDFDAVEGKFVTLETRWPLERVSIPLDVFGRIAKQLCYDRDHRSNVYLTNHEVVNTLGIFDDVVASARDSYGPYDIGLCLVNLYNGKSMPVIEMKNLSQESDGRYLVTIRTDFTESDLDVSGYNDVIFGFPPQETGFTGVHTLNMSLQTNKGGNIGTMECVTSVSFDQKSGEIQVWCKSYKL